MRFLTGSALRFACGLRSCTGMETAESSTATQGQGRRRGSIPWRPRSGVRSAFSPPCRVPGDRPGARGRLPGRQLKRVMRQDAISNWCFLTFQPTRKCVNWGTPCCSGSKVCVTLSRPMRERSIADLREAWEARADGRDDLGPDSIAIVRSQAQAKAEFALWYSVKDSSTGQESGPENVAAL